MTTIGIGWNAAISLLLLLLLSLLLRLIRVLRVVLLLLLLLCARLLTVAWRRCSTRRRIRAIRLRSASWLSILSTSRRIGTVRLRSALSIRRRRCSSTSRRVGAVRLRLAGRRRAIALLLLLLLLKLPNGRRVRTVRRLGRSSGAANRSTIGRACGLRLTRSASALNLSAALALHLLASLAREAGVKGRNAWLLILHDGRRGSSVHGLLRLSGVLRRVLRVLAMHRSVVK